MTVRGANPVINTTQSSTEGMEEEEEKPRTLLIGNIPREVHKREIEDIFGDVGPLKRCYIQYPRDDKKKRGGDSAENTLLCYVTYALAEDALKALETLGSTKVGGKKIFIKFAKTRSEQQRTPLERDPSEEEESRGRNRARGDDDDVKNPNMIPVDGVKPQRPKQPRVKTENKKSRLIIRNLSFRVTEEKMKEYFSTCGQIKDINILKKPDGKLVGCAFVQFSTVPEAAKAVRDLNLKPFLGRPIAIDWALPKKDFQQGAEKEEEVTEIKSENEDEDNKEDVKIMPEIQTDGKLSNPYEHLGFGGSKIEIKIEDDSDTDEKRQKRKRKFKDEEDSDEDDDDDEDEEEEEEEIKKPRRSNDVEEGRTLFIRNLDFGVTQEQLKEFFETYGETNYALLCKDNLTEHPKGTGFVKFKNAESVNKCMEDFNINSGNFKLGNRVFSITLALAREKVETLSTKDKPKDGNAIKHDNRNLYLTREGFIRPGSGAAEGVSLTDMHKRGALNSTKKQMLKNLSIFVSPTRVCVHNLPLHLTDKALRKLFKKYADPQARITEARIMRDMNEIQIGGKGKSKGYGFVTFTQHEHALAALRAVNNNPDVFSHHSRPIVEFSLENKKALKAKEKRMEKSKENNKQVPIKKPAAETEGTATATTSSTPKSKKRRRNQKIQKGPNSQKDSQKIPSNNSEGNDDKQPSSYSGLKGKPGVSKLPLMRPKGKGKITRKSLSSKNPPKRQERRMREAMPKQKRNLDKSDNVDKLVNKYKNNLEKTERTGNKKGKWYQKKNKNE